MYMQSHYHSKYAILKSHCLSVIHISPLTCYLHVSVHVCLCEQHAEEQQDQLREQQQLCGLELSAPVVALRQPDHLHQPRSVWHSALTVHTVSAHTGGHNLFTRITCIIIDNTVFILLSNLLANPFNCNCHLAWLGDWLRRKRIVTGNPRCQNPYFLKEIPIQDVAVQDFACDDGERDIWTLCV